MVIWSAEPVDEGASGYALRVAHARSVTTCAGFGFTGADARGRRFYTSAAAVETGGGVALRIRRSWALEARASLVHDLTMGDCVASYPGPDCHSSFRLMGGAVSIVHLDRTDGPIGLAIGGGVGGYRTRAPFRVDGQEATTILGVHARAETAVFATGVVTSTIGTQITVFPNVSGQTVTHLSLRLGFRLWGPTGLVDQRDD